MVTEKPEGSKGFANPPNPVSGGGLIEERGGLLRQNRAKKRKDLLRADYGIAISAEGTQVVRSSTGLHAT